MKNTEWLLTAGVFFLCSAFFVSPLIQDPMLGSVASIVCAAIGSILIGKSFSLMSEKAQNLQERLDSQQKQLNTQFDQVQKYRETVLNIASQILCQLQEIKAESADQYCRIETTLKNSKDQLSAEGKQQSEELLKLLQEFVTSQSEQTKLRSEYEEQKLEEFIELLEEKSDAVCNGLDSCQNEIRERINELVKLTERESLEQRDRMKEQLDDIEDSLDNGSNKICDTLTKYCSAVQQASEQYGSLTKQDAEMLKRIFGE